MTCCAELVQSQVCRTQQDLIGVQETWRGAYEGKDGRSDARADGDSRGRKTPRAGVPRGDLETPRDNWRSGGIRGSARSRCRTHTRSATLRSRSVSEVLRVPWRNRARTVS